MPNWKKVIVSGSDAILNKVTIPGNSGATTFTTNADTLIFSGSAYFTGSVNITGSLQATSITGSLLGTSSYADYALTASYALNGGGGGGGGSVFSYHQTSSAVTWSISHNLNTYTPIIQVYDDSYNQIIPASISGSSVNTVQITFSTAETGYAVLTTGGNVNISGSNATLVQSTPATTWSFAHGLNEKYPVFTIFDNNDDVIVPLKIHADNANTASIYFTTARTGTAVAANCGLSGSTFVSSSYALTASYVANASSFPYTGSALITGSLGIIGNSTITGSFLVSGSTTQIGSNNLIGNTILSGSIGVSGSISGSADLTIGGTFRLDPAIDPGPNNNTASYLFTSASNTQTGYDLYYRQDGNLIKFKWIEGGVSSGLLYGGGISFSGSTIYVKAGTGIINNMNASTGSEINPILTYVKWNDYTASAQYLTSSQNTYLYVDDSGSVHQQTSFFDQTQYEQALPLGRVTHPNFSSITGYGSNVQTTYNSDTQQNDFIRAFGPIKVSGFSINAQTGSLRLGIGNGIAYNLGGFYTQDPNSPSHYESNGFATASIARAWRSGSGVYLDNNGGAFYNAVDPDYWDDGTGTLNTMNAGDWQIQRVFANPVTGRVVVYYGQNIYTNLLNALQYLATDSFTEGEFTAKSLVFVGYLVLKGQTNNLTDTTNNRIINAGIFRNIAGGSAGGGAVAQRLENLADVNITTPSQHQALIYDSGVWVNGTPVSSSYAISSSYSLSGSFASTSTSSSYAQTASYVLNAVSSSYASSALSSSYAISSSYANSATTASYILNAISTSYASNADLLDGKDSTVFATTGSNTFKGNQTISGSNAELLLTGGGSYGTINFHNFNASIFDYVGAYHLRLQANSIISNKTNNFTILDSSDVVKLNITGNLFDIKTNTTVTGSLNVTAGITGSLLGTASYASNSDLLDGLDSTVFLQTGSFNTFSSSYSTRVTDVEATASAYVATSGSFSTRITNTEATASSYVTTSGSLSTRVTTIESKYATTGSNTFNGNQTVTTGYITLTQVSQSLNFADDTAAAAGGVPLGGLYRNGNFIAIRIV
jgi:hypothetical protein